MLCTPKRLKVWFVNHRRLLLLKNRAKNVSIKLENTLHPLSIVLPPKLKIENPSKQIPTSQEKIPNPFLNSFIGFNFGQFQNFQKNIPPYSSPFCQKMNFEERLKFSQFYAKTNFQNNFLMNNALIINSLAANSMLGTGFCKTETPYGYNFL